MSRVDKVVATRSFENSVKSLKKKHKTAVLEELRRAVDDLVNLRVTTQKSNHPLKNAEGHKDLHLDGGRLILLYRYDDDTLYLALRLQDIVDHKELNNYTKYDAPAHDYNQSNILSSTSSENFFNWYNSLEEEEQWSVDSIADREGVPNYDEADEVDLSRLKEQYFKESINSRRLRAEILKELEQLADSRIKGFKKYEKAGLYFEKHSLQSLWNNYLKYYNQNVAEYGDGYAADWEDDLKISILYKDGKIKELSPEWDEGTKKVSPDNIDSIVVDGSWGTAFAGPSIIFRDETVYDDIIDIRADFV